MFSKAKGLEPRSPVVSESPPAGRGYSHEMKAVFVSH